MLQCAQKLATQFGDCHALISFWKNSLADYHGAKKVVISVKLKMGINIITFFSGNTVLRPLPKLQLQKEFSERKSKLTLFSTV